MKKLLAITLSFFICQISFSQDWQNFPIPADPGQGNVWELQTSYSDDFNYNGKTTDFTSKWNDSYFKNWSGPGLTKWNSQESAIQNGNLEIRASRKPGVSQVNCGVLTSKTKVVYPIYMEARIKVSNLELSSNFWMLSEDDEREIDVLEIYGGSSSTWFAERASSNFHVFFRDNNNNEILSDYASPFHHTLPNNGLWRDDFHTYGVYWKSPTEIYFYIDGVQDGSWSETQMYDKDHTQQYLDKNAYNIDRAMYMVFDTEDHSWRSDQGFIDTDADLADTSKNRMYVDWVRTYKPVADIANDPGTVSFENTDYYLNTHFRTSGTLDVHYNYFAGTNATIDTNGVKIWLREITSNWTVVNDYTVIDHTVAKQSSGSSSASIDLSNVPATSSLPSGNFYFLYITYTNSRGEEVDASIQPIQIEEEFMTSNRNCEFTNIQIFPNPIQNEINFNTRVEYEIYSLTGVKVVEGFGNKANTARLPKGVYFLEIEDTNFKFIKH